MCIRDRHLCNSEIEQLNHAVAGNKNVSRLQIAVHNQMLVGVTNSMDDTLKQFHPLADVQLSVVAPAMNRQPFHKLHDEVGPALLRYSCVEELGDIRVVQRSEYLAFLVE